MTDSAPFRYRVKFKDIRVNPPADETSRARAKQTRVCDEPGCDLEGSHPAPRPGGKGRHFFCEAHASAYNRTFNFFEGMSEAEAAAFVRSERFGHKRTWRFGAGPMGGARAARSHDPRRWAGRGFFDMDETAAEEAKVAAHRSSLQIRALRELDLEPEATPQEIRARYAEYVRRFHPDSNKGDRSSEHKLERVVRAGKLLKASGLMRG
jgi:DnaJ domain